MHSIDKLYLERFIGRLVATSKAPPSLLVVGTGTLPTSCKAVHRGELVIRFGYPLLHTQDVIFPTMVIDDFRREYPGKAAVSFMVHKGNSYPRADVVGLMQSSLSRADLFMKEVDIADGLRVYAFASDQIDSPLARVTAVVWLDPKVEVIEELSSAPGTKESLLPHAARCFQCAPAALPNLVERIGPITNP